MKTLVVIQNHQILPYLQNISNIKIIYLNEINYIIDIGKVLLFANNIVLKPQDFDLIYFPQFTQWSIIKLFEEAGFNTMPTCNNILLRHKILQYSICAKNNILIPKTFNCLSEHSEAIIKPSWGSLGTGIALIKGPKRTSLSSPIKVFQENITNENPKKDIRTLIYNKTIIGSFIKYNTNEKTIATNVALNHNAEKYELNEEESIFCKKVAEVFSDVKLFGLDFIKDKEGNIYFLEINMFQNPIFCDITNINFYKEILNASK